MSNDEKTILLLSQIMAMEAMMMTLLNHLGHLSADPEEFARTFSSEAHSMLSRISEGGWKTVVKEMAAARIDTLMS